MKFIKFIPVTFTLPLLLIFAAACVPSPAAAPPTLAALSATPYASLTPITPTPMPSSTSTPAPPTATATEIPDVREIRSVIHAYFDIRYRAFVAMVPLQPEEFSDVVSAHPEAAVFLNAELEKLAIQMKWYELTNLGLVSYEFFFTDEEILIENSGLVAKVALKENARYSRQRSPSTITSRFNVRHEILLRKENGVWKIISDQYTDEFWKTIRNSSRSPQEILEDLAVPAMEIGISKKMLQTDSLCEIPINQTAQEYDREGSKEYALQYVKAHNPKYPYFDSGDPANPWGNCTNFVSQAIHEGGKISMAYCDPGKGHFCTPNQPGDAGWYYTDMNNRGAAWVWVDRFHLFVTNDPLFVNAHR